ncbi:hypothetical protein BDK51DRAFT_39146 [Blyttiomyces helicus]|uniref:Uncharacterized protein n=1 Tax=Blyttiomyces helicus TaxID=388810 RepID=A0A4P9VZQ1_9FUNG|nr:hypothetical protein BDK51DRAFT_39146 [Blyttiomyces helicus]|eukprot:RKO85311.1 hypothetical protein BDK51DRAFT_39146 [Blyttiomyces helicus]
MSSTFRKYKSKWQEGRRQLGAFSGLVLDHRDSSPGSPGLKQDFFQRTPQRIASVGAVAGSRGKHATTSHGLMIVRKLDPLLNEYGPAREGEEILGSGYPYLAAIGALAYVANST